MLLKHIYGDGDYLTGGIFLYFTVVVIATHETLLNDKEKREPKETLKKFWNIIIWPVWAVVYFYNILKDVFKGFWE